MNSIKKILKDWFTEPNNETYCLIKALMASGFLTIGYSAIVQVLHTHALDYASFGAAFAAVSGAGGAGLYLKKDTPQ